MLDLDRIREKTMAEYVSMTPVGMHYIITVGNKATWANDELISYVHSNTLLNITEEEETQLEDLIIHNFEHMHDDGS